MTAITDPRVTAVAAALENAAFPDGHPYRHGVDELKDDYENWQTIFTADAAVAVTALDTWQQNQPPQTGDPAQ